MASDDYRVGPAPASLAGTLAPEPGEDADDADFAPWNEPPEVREGCIEETQHGLRLDKAVVALAPEFSRTHLQGLIDGGHVRLDDRVVSGSSRKVAAG